MQKEEIRVREKKWAHCKNTLSWTRLFITIRWHLWEILRTKKSSKASPPSMAQNCPFGVCTSASNMWQWKVEESFPLILWWFWWLPMLLARQGDPTWDIFYTAQWRGRYHDLWGFFCQWNNGACTEVSNVSLLWRCCRGVDGKFIKVDAGFRNWMPFVKSSSPLELTFPPAFWKH